MTINPYAATTDTDQASPDLARCDFCHRLTPLTTAILAGHPLGDICTCAIELRAIERVSRQLRQREALRSVEGH